MHAANENIPFGTDLLTGIIDILDRPDDVIVPLVQFGRSFWIEHTVVGRNKEVVTVSNQDLQVF